ATAGPRAKVDCMKLAKPERWLGRADRDRNETFRISSFGRLVLDPRGVERGARPENNDRIRVLECLLYLLVKTRSTVKVTIPPNIVTGMCKILRELPRRVDVVSSIAEKDPRHRSSRSI